MPFYHVLGQMFQFEVGGGGRLENTKQIWLVCQISEQNVFNIISILLL
jgi:hypothetical protein